MTKDGIIKLRERLVELSTDPIETRDLLDKLEGEILWDNYLNSPLHVDKNDIQETKDGEFYKLHKIRDGYLLQYHGGYTVKIDDKLFSTASAVEMMMSNDNDENAQLAAQAIDMIFRLPMFVFSHPETTFTLAEVGVRYMLLLQQMGEVPTDETENTEYDKYLLQLNELMENFAAGLEKEGKEYERRFGNAEEKENKGEREDKGQKNAE